MMKRLRVLLTGKVTWEYEDGTTETERMSWRDRWAVFGVHSYNWRWVDRLGRMRCGCTRNPLTRSLVVIAMDCPQHGVDWAEEDGT